MFAPLIENNEAEGESWRYWLQTIGNQSQLAALADLIGDDADEYDLDLDNLTPESDVDALVRHTAVEYLPLEQKFTGTFTCPGDLDKLYKGGIEDCFTGTPSIQALPGGAI